MMKCGVIVEHWISSWSVPDLSKRSIWAFKALNLYFWSRHVTRILSNCHRSPLNNHLFFLNHSLSFIERTQLSIILLDNHLFIWGHVYKKDDIESWSPGVRQAGFKFLSLWLYHSLIVCPWARLNLKPCISPLSKRIIPSS